MPASAIAFSGWARDRPAAQHRAVAPCRRSRGASREAGCGTAPNARARPPAAREGAGAGSCTARGRPHAPAARAATTGASAAGRAAARPATCVNGAARCLAIAPCGWRRTGPTRGPAGRGPAAPAERARTTSGNSTGSGRRPAARAAGGPRPAPRRRSLVGTVRRLEPKLESPVQVGVDRQIGGQDLCVQILQFLEVLPCNPLLVPEQGRGRDQDDEPHPGLRIERSAVRPSRSAAEAGEGVNGAANRRLGGFGLASRPGKGGRACLLQPVGNAGPQIGTPLVEEALDLPSEFFFVSVHSLIPLASSILARACTAR